MSVLFYSGGALIVIAMYQLFHGIRITQMLKKRGSQ